MENKKELEELKQTAITLRKMVLTMIYEAQSGHPGGSLSATDIVTALYFHAMNISPETVKDPDRDRFVLSKGHVCPIQYSALMLKGILPMEAIHTLRKQGSILQGHPDMKRCPGIEISTGSLGQGFSCALGMAIAGKNDGRDYMTYALVGDGECNEGQIWEAAQAAAKYQLDNFVLLVDNNRLQNDGAAAEIMPTQDLRAKFEAFGFDAVRINGHEMEEIVDALDAAKATRDALGAEIMALAKEHNEVYVIDCDVAKSCKTLDIEKELPLQHVQAGIAEANAMDIAAGLATCGKKPYVVTYAVFGAMRACEQIRQEICYTKLNVKILCSHGGLTPANDGASHQCVEDMGVLRTIPNMTVIMPADYNSARALIRASYDYQGPAYLRFTRDAIPEIYKEDEEFVIGKCKKLCNGSDITIFANGDTVAIALEAVQLLKEEGISAALYDAHTIKPFDREAVAEAINSTGKIITVEDHNILNALGSAVCEVVAEEGRGQVKRIGVQDHFGESAPYGELLKMNGITCENIAATAKEMLGR